MNCIYCGTPLSDIDYCTGCGADITILKRVARISNLLYNEGLDKARVRDLSGAIKSLKRSLEFNKENKDARNLLGLVYFESGEVVSALTEWVISKNMNPDDNLAEYYIDKLQSNKNKLDMINQTIRKYNQALVYCREDHDDMAMIQLKKVLSRTKTDQGIPPFSVALSETFRITKKQENCSKKQHSLTQTIQRHSAISRKWSWRPVSAPVWMSNVRKNMQKKRLIA